MAAAAAGAVTSAAPPGAPNGTMQPQQQMQMAAAASQQFLAAQQNAAYAAQQAAPYVINPGQEAGPYMGLIATQMPQYYGVAPWGMYPGNLIPQQGTQPRRPLTPSQQTADNQSYQVSSWLLFLLSPSTQHPFLSFVIIIFFFLFKIEKRRLLWSLPQSFFFHGSSIPLEKF